MAVVCHYCHCLLAMSPSLLCLSMSRRDLSRAGLFMQCQLSVVLDIWSTDVRTVWTQTIFLLLLGRTLLDSHTNLHLSVPKHDGGTVLLLLWRRSLARGASQQFFCYAQTRVHCVASLSLSSITPQSCTAVPVPNNMLLSNHG